MLGGLCAKRLIYWLGSLLLWTRLETILKKFPKMIDSDHRYKQMRISKAGWTLVRGREGNDGHVTYCYASHSGLCEGLLGSGFPVCVSQRSTIYNHSYESLSFLLLTPNAVLILL